MRRSLFIFMKTSPVRYAGALVAGVFLSGAASASPIEFSITSIVSVVEGSYAGIVLEGDIITGTFIVDNDTANAGPGSDPGPSFLEGHEYSSFWEFPGAPYAVSLFNPRLGTGFVNDPGAFPAIVVNNNLLITADETGGLIPTGYYDWIEILGATTTSYCPEPGGICTPEQYQR